MSEKEKTNKGAGQVIQAETFRDSIGTMESTGKRKWVYAKKTKGKVYQLQRFGNGGSSHCIFWSSICKNQRKSFAQN